MAKERADELVQQAQEIAVKGRDPTFDGAQSILDDIKAWEKECSDFILEHGPNAKNDIPKEQMKAINLAAKDLHMERWFNIFMREVYAKGEVFETIMSDMSADVEENRNALQSQIEKFGKFINDFKESNRVKEFQERRPDEFKRMLENMEEAVAKLDHVLLVTPSALEEFTDDPEDNMHKSIGTMMKLLESENYPGLDEIKKERAALARSSYEEDTSEDEIDDPRRVQYLEIQRKLLKAMLGVDGPMILKSGNQALMTKYNEILDQLNNPEGNNRQAQNEIFIDVVSLHERLVDVKIRNVLQEMKTILSKSNKEKEGKLIAEFREVFEQVEQDNKKIKNTSLDYKVATLIALEGGLENLKRLMPAEKKAPQWKKSLKPVERPAQFRDSRNIERASQTDPKKPMMGSRSQQKENRSDDEKMQGPSRRSS